MKDPVTSGEISKRLGVHRQTVTFWRKQTEGFPKPVRKIGGYDVFEWEEVLQYCSGGSPLAVVSAMRWEKENQK